MAKNQIKTKYGNIEREQYTQSIMMHGKNSLLKFHKWLDRQNKLLGTNLTINDFMTDKNA